MQESRNLDNHTAFFPIKKRSETKEGAQKAASSFVILLKL